MTRAMDIGYFPNRNLRCPGCDARLSGDSVEYARIARDMAEMVGEIDPMGSRMPSRPRDTRPRGTTRRMWPRWHRSTWTR